jgi:phospholipase A1/A2
MKKYLLAAIVMLVCSYTQAQVTDSMSMGLSGYKSIYFISGIGDDQVKLQFSLKYDFFYPFMNKIGLYLGYTQLMLWDIYKLSGPFKCIDFNPEVFWRFESGNNFLDDAKLPGFDYIQLGFWEHLSNGKDGLDSRGYYRSYVQLQLSTPFWINFGVNLKAFYVWAKEENSDIEDFLGNYEAMVFLRILDDQNRELEEIYCRFASGGGLFGLDFSKGYQEIGVKVRPIVARIRPYIQLYRGYGESIITYNAATSNSLYNRDFSVRIGIIVE